MMHRSPTEFIEIAYQFYPQGVYPDSPEYVESEETRGLMAARLHASANRERWNALLARLGEQFSECSVQDWAFHLAAASSDASYSGKLVLPTLSSTEGQHALCFRVSFLAPCYVVYGEIVRFLDAIDEHLGHRKTATPELRFSLLPEERGFADGLTQAIESEFTGYDPMPPDIGHSIVPNIALACRQPGEATIYDCLMSDHGLPRPGY